MKAATPIKFAVVGIGYWGPNLVRALLNMRGGKLVAVCDKDPRKIKFIHDRFGDIESHNDVDEMLMRDDLDAVCISTPIESHFPIAKRCLAAKKHVFVEKPLATNASECRELIACAEKAGRYLMVGHTFLYNAAVQKVKEYIENGTLGDVYYILTQRLNLGRIQSTTNPLWSLAPHDISIVLYWMNEMPARLQARGFSYIHPSVEDIVFLDMVFKNKVTAHVACSWLNPEKVRKITVVGSQRMLVYDDISIDSKITIFDKGVDKVTLEKLEKIDMPDYVDYGDFQLRVRSGDILIPRVAYPEPVATEMAHFRDCIAKNQPPLTDGRNGLDTVRVLEAASESLKKKKEIVFS